MKTDLRFRSTAARTGNPSTGRRAVVHHLTGGVAYWDGGRIRHVYADFACGNSSPHFPQLIDDGPGLKRLVTCNGCRRASGFDT